VNKEIFTTPKALIEKISDIYDIPVENAIIFDNDVIMETITDIDCIPLTASEKK